MSRGQTLADTLARRRDLAPRHPASGEERSNWQTVWGWIGRLPLLILAIAPAWWKGGVHLAEQQWIGPLLLISLGAWSVQLLTSGAARQTSRLPLLVVPVLLGVFLGLVQRVPLPNDWAPRLAPRQHALLEELASPAGMPQAPPTPATRIGVDAYGGEHQWTLLLYSGAMLLLGARFFIADGHAWILLLATALNGAALSVVGVLQRTGWDQGWLQVTSVYRGEPFATFVNRNNAAGYLVLCFAAALGLLVWEFLTVRRGGRPYLIVSREIPIWRRAAQSVSGFLAQLNRGRMVSLALVLLVGLGVFASLSRGGVVAFFVALLITAVAFGFRRHSADAAFGITALAVLAILGLALWLGIGESLTRRFAMLQTGSAATDQLRFRNWVETWPAVGDFGPLGCGLDSYHAVHRLYRQDAESSYFQYAENIFFQTLVEMGWFGLALLLAAVGLSVWSSIFVSNRGNSPRTVALGAMSIFAIAGTSVASCFDFGLYLPANSLLLACLTGVAAYHGHALAQRLKERYLLRHNLAAWMTWPLVGLALAGVGWGSWRMAAWAEQRAAAGDWLFLESHVSLTSEQTTDRIEHLRPLFVRTPTDWGGLRLAELYIHRFRLQRWDELQRSTADAPETLWTGTSLLRFREQIYLDNRIGGERRVRRLLQHPAVRENLIPAWNCLMMARNRQPLNSQIQLLLAQLQPALGDLEDQVGCDRTLATAPTNAEYWFVVGAMHLQAGRIDEACRTWRRCLELDSYQQLDRVVQWIHPTETAAWKIPLERVVREILPDAPLYLSRFARQHLGGADWADLRRELLQRTDELLMNQPAESDPEWVGLVARVKRDLGDLPAAIGRFRWLQQLQPENLIARYELARVLADNGDYEAAWIEISWLMQHDSQQVGRYRVLYDALRRRLKKD